MPAAVRTDGLTKRYGVTPALAPVDLELAAHGGAVLLGSNGTGKTTLLRLLAGLARPSGGTAAIFGVDPTLPEARRALGYAPESTPFAPRAPVAATLERLGRLSGLTAADARTRTTEVLERLGLAAVAAARAGTLSRGMTQRLSLAQAILHRPRLLLLDEPLGGLDRGWRDAVVALIAEVRAAGTAVVVATHTPEAFGAHLPRRWVLEDAA